MEAFSVQEANLRATDIRASVDKTEQQAVPNALVRHDAVPLGEKDVGSVGACLIPALDSCADGACNDGEVELPGQSPLVLDLFLEDLLFLISQLFVAVDVFVFCRILGDQGALAQDRDVFGQAFLLREGLGAAHQLISWNASQWVLDSAQDDPC